MDVPKENFGIRPAVIMDPLDRLSYQALVDVQSARLIGGLDQWVCGWRLPRIAPEGRNYRTNRSEWAQYRVSLAAYADLNSVGLKTDVTSCFSSMPIPGVVSDIYQYGASGPALERLVDIVVSLDKTPGRSGLMQRSKASAVLANMYLQRLDDPLRHHNQSLPRGHGLRKFPFRSGGVARWMDDIWVFGSDEAALRKVQVDLQNVGRNAGLELNLGKTSVKSGQELVAAVKKIQHSAIDDALDAEPSDQAPLEELLDTIIDDPAQADRTTIRFALSRMKKHKIHSRREKLINSIEKMPHGADHLARAFRDLGWWKELQDWYLEYKDGQWAHFPWSVARLGAMFPTRGDAAVHLCNAFADTLSSRPPLPLMALTAQRLAFWDSERARDVICELLLEVDNPHERRVLSLTLLHVAKERKLIRRSLSDFEENALTLRMIEDGNFQPFNVSADFSASETDDE
ncbi:RNA-directed DNA polymerase [Amycolatopsis sp. NBC_01307]|uniref:RNA-directed DNA polymerase n=1 Tax=Amycolatopsis sp. NBC_01307 TaxID=2903561 RepID=UPI002E0E7C81|nr:RNA-directed DNA polymerase [Amycolatopsis sp. NBC_01307]